MNRQYIRDHQVIERYLARALTTDEEREFEEAYLEDPEVFEELQAAERLREGIKQLDAAGRLERPRWLKVLISPQYAAAASVLLVVSLVFSTTLYRENQSLRDRSFSAGSAITRVVFLEAVRGASAMTIPAAEDDEWTALHLDAAFAEYDSYRAVLARRDGDRLTEVWNRAGLRLVLGETIAIVLPGRELPPGSYEARLEGRMDEWPAERFDGISIVQMTVVPRD